MIEANTDSFHVQDDAVNQPNHLFPNLIRN